MSRLTLQGTFTCGTCGKELHKQLSVSMSTDGLLSIDPECFKDYQLCPICNSSTNAYMETTGTQFTSGRSLINEVRELRQSVIQHKYELNNVNAHIDIEKSNIRKLLEGIETRLASVEDDITSLRLWMNE